MLLSRIAGRRLAGVPFGAYRNSTPPTWARAALGRRFKSEEATEEGEGAQKGGGSGKMILGLAGATLIGGAAAYIMQQDPSSQKAIDEHNAAIANQGLPARQRLNQTSPLTSLLVNNQASKLASCHGVSEILTCWLGANSHLEDRHSEHFLGDYGVLVGIYDGHSGFQAADALSTFLPTYVKQQMESSKPNTIQETAEALVRAFETLDHDLVDVVPKAALETKDSMMMEAFVNPAFAGSVACVALINPTGIYVANTGDCRAVLGVERSDGEVGAAQLSNDQTGNTPSEVARIQCEHPGEETCVVRGRVLGGLQPTRAFGDARYKWDAKRLEAVGAKVPKNSYTPPYVTARPEVLHASIDSSAKFLIVATDGVWDMVSSHEAVQVVSEALRSGSSSLLAAAQLTRRTLQKYADEGTNGDIDALLDIKAPQARNYRDDITCSVVILEPEVVVGGKEAAPAADATTPSIASNLDKPVSQTLMDIFHKQLREHNVKQSG